MQWLDFLQRSSKLLPPPTKREWELMNIPSEFSLYLKNVWRKDSKISRISKSPSLPFKVKPNLDLLWRSLAEPGLIGGRQWSEQTDQRVPGQIHEIRRSGEIRRAETGSSLWSAWRWRVMHLAKKHQAVIAALLVNHENPTQPPCTTSLTIGCFPRYQCSHRQLYALAGTGAFFAARWHAVFFHSAAALLQNCWLEGACWVWDSLQKIHTQDWVPFKPI